MTPSTQDSSLTPEGDAPFTDEQLRWLSAREHMLSSHGTHYSRTHMKRYARSATAAFIVLALAVGGAFYTQGHDSAAQRTALQNNGRAAAAAIVASGRAVSVSGCNRDFTSAIRLRGLLKDSEEATIRAHAKGQIPDDQFRDAKDFYAKQLAGLPLPDCRVAEQVVTADPNARTVIPTPRYPGDLINRRTGG